MSTPLYHNDGVRKAEDFAVTFFRDVDLFPTGSDVLVKVNGMEVPISSLPYQHPSGKLNIFIFIYYSKNTDLLIICVYNKMVLVLGSIQIRQKAQGLVLHAPSLGLQEVYFSKDTWRVNTA